MKILPLIGCLLLAACAADDQPTRSTRTGPGITSGSDLIRAMHDRYAGRWYRGLRLEQKVTTYRDGEPAGEEIWTEVIQLPGRVLSIAGDPAAGNRELFIDGTSYIYRGDRLVRQTQWTHSVLILGFDVYVQQPGITAAQLIAGGFDLSRLREAEWNGRPVYVVGAPDGDGTTNQFWVDRETLLCVRTITRSPTGSVIAVEFDGYRPLGGGWIATRLVFRRNGELLLTEDYLSYTEEHEIDPAIFLVPAGP